MFWWPIDTLFSTAISFRTCSYKPAQPQRAHTISLFPLLFSRSTATILSINYHMFSTRHQPLIDHFGREIPACIDMHAFLHHWIGTCPQRLPSLVPTRLDLGPLAGLRLWSHLPKIDYGAISFDRGGFRGRGQLSKGTGGDRLVVVACAVWFLSWSSVSLVASSSLSSSVFPKWRGPCQRDRSDGISQMR